VAWNVGPLTWLQYKVAVDRHDFYHLHRFRSIIPMVQLSWNVARTCRPVRDRRHLVELLRSFLGRSLAACTASLQCATRFAKEVKWHGREDGEPAHYCENCEVIIIIMFALPIASCGLKLDDEAVRVAVGLRLGLDLCIPHQCQCGSPLDARGLHSFVCRRAPGRSARHDALNDLVARCFASAGTPVTKEPTGLFRTDGKRPDGLTPVPWQSGKSLCWDVTVICRLAESYVTGSAREAVDAAELAASRIEEKYASIGSEYLFALIAVETLGKPSACQLFSVIIIINVNL